ncbi:MAG: bifunctional ADP-dependent NAD(P)H-hydrate dehydratase/NAD(P)H-hydrate epimerase [Treponema sp.]|nr:bifunctional ADP-dependent NAD(P)H-hydrate dehydratase/NAD(P)H-hydrate epimerase [Treponema sp.]
MSALVSAAGAKALDVEASAHWGLNSFALVEAAGRVCAESLLRVAKINKKKNCLLAVFAGSGNNAADALVMLKSLILNGYAKAGNCQVFCAKLPPASADGPLPYAVLAAQKLGVPVTAWDPHAAAAALAKADAAIDGIAGTGLDGPLRGIAREMAEALNASALVKDGPRIVSIDMPSGNFDGWGPGMPIVAAHATLAIEPQKLCLYCPSARPYAGEIVPVGGVFPPALIEKYREAELVSWEYASGLIPPVPKTAYKHERGLVEIRAGSPGSAGAALLAALGAQAAGAGLVRLIVDPSLYSVVAPACSGIMAVPDDASCAAENSRFAPDAVLLGPGWGRGEARLRLLESCLPLEKQGIPLVLDADAIALSKDIVFNGNAIITPHAGEFSAVSGFSKDEILKDPVPLLRRYAAEEKVHILLKGHVLYAASPDGRIGIIDGMNPALAAGGSGDVLAGFCAAIMARCGDSGLWWQCACAAASLLMRAAEADGVGGTFFDPAKLAPAAAAIAGSAWLRKEAL